MSRKAPRREEARKFLRQLLCNSDTGSLAVETIRTHTERLGFKWITVRRAKSGLAKSRKRGRAPGGGYWVCKLEETVEPPIEADGEPS